MLSTPRFSLSVSALPLSARAHRATPRFQRAHPSCTAARSSSGVKSGEGWPQRPRPVASKRGSEWHGRLGAAAPDRRGLRALWAQAAILRRRSLPSALGGAPAPGRQSPVPLRAGTGPFSGLCTASIRWGQQPGELRERASELGLLERLLEPEGGRSAAGSRAASLAASGLAFRLFVTGWGITWRSLLYKITRCLSVRQRGGSLLCKVTQCLAMQRSGCCVCVNNEQPCLLPRCSCMCGWLLSAFPSKAI